MHDVLCSHTMVSSKYAASHTLDSENGLEIELWLDYICPFSKKLFLRVYKEVIPAVRAYYPGKIKWTFNHQVQPWHPQGAILHEYALAVSEAAPEKFWEFSLQLFNASQQFYDEAVVDKSRNQLIGELGEIAKSVGIDPSSIEPLVLISSGEPKNKGSPTIDKLKYYIKLGRQAGIHASPTVVVDLLVDNNVSSGWSKDNWLHHVEGLLQE